MSDDAASYLTLLLNGKFVELHILSIIVFCLIITLFNHAVGL